MKVGLNKKLYKKYAIKHASYIMFVVDFKHNLLTEEEFVKDPVSCIVFKMPYESIHDTFEVIDSKADTLLHKHTYEPFKELFNVIEE